MTSLLFWFFNYIILSHDYAFIDCGYIILISIPVLSSLILFRKTIFQYFLKKPTWSDIAEKYEKRKYFAGEIISGADYIESNYSHHKSLEEKFIDSIYNKLISIPIYSLFQPKRLLRPFIFMFSTLLFLSFCSIVFPYTPIDSLKQAFTSQAKSEIIYELDYSDKLSFGDKFFLKVTTNADIATLYFKMDRDELKKSLTRKIIDQKNNLFKYTYNKLDKPVSFYLILRKKGDQLKTSTIKVLPHDKLAIKVKATLIFPKAYKLADKVEEDGNVEGFVDTKVKLEITSNNRLKSGEMFFSSNYGFDSYPSPVDIDVIDKKGSCEFTISEAANYQIVVQDEFGNENPEQSFFINVLEDLPPEVEILKPGKNQTLKSIIDQHILVEAKDDFTVQRLYLYYSIISKKRRKGKNKAIKLKIKPSSLVQGIAKIPLSRMNLKPGNIIEYYAKAIDHGGQFTLSEPKQFIIPALKEFFKNINSQTEKEMKKVSALLEEYKKFNKQSQKAFKDFENKTLKGKELLKKLKELAKKEQELLEKFRKAIRGLENLDEQIKNRKNVSVSEFREKINEAKTLMKELLKAKIEDDADEEQKSLTEQLKKNIKEAKQIAELEKKLKGKNLSKKELKKQLREFRKKENALRNKLLKSKKEIEKFQSLLKNLKIDNKDVNKKLEQIQKLLSELLKKKNGKGFKDLEKLMKFMNKKEYNQLYKQMNRNWNQERFVKRLDKTLEKLKRLKKLQSLLEARHLIKNLKHKQKKLNKAIKKSVNNKKKLKSLQKKTAQIKKKNEELFKKLKSKNKKAQSEGKNKAIEKQIQEALKQMKEHLQNKNKKDALETGKQLSSQFGQMEQKIEKMIQQFQQMDKKEIQKFLRNLLLELVELRKLEGKKSKIITAGKRNPNFDKEYVDKLIETTLFSKNYLTHRRKQFDKKFEGALKYSDKQKFLFLFGQIANRLQNSGESISKKDFYYAYHSQKEILQNLNHLTLMLMKLKMKSNQNKKQGSGASQSVSLSGLEQLMRFQQQINNEIQEMFQRQNQKGMSKADQKKLSELSKKQGDIGKQIDKMLNNEKGSGNKTTDKLLGSLAEIKREIDEIKQKLHNQQLDKKLIAQQQKLLNRLSDAAKHLKRGESIEGPQSTKMTKKKKERKSKKPTLLYEERNLIEAKKKLRTMLKKQKRNKNKNSKRLNPTQKELVKNYFKNLEEFAKK